MPLTHGNILTDRGSRYAASKAEALALLKRLKRRKKLARATHSTWALLLPDRPLKNTDG